MTPSRDYQMLNTCRIILLTVTLVNVFFAFAHGQSPSGSVSSSAGLLPCSYRGQIILHGEPLIVDVCTTCSCDNSTVKCDIKSCPPTFCDEPIVSQAECCDLCPYYVPVWKVTPKNIDVITEGNVNDLEVDLNLKINDKGQGVNGYTLWKVGVWASSRTDGSGDRVSYRENVLTEAQAATQLARPPLFGGFEFNIQNIAFELDGTGRTCRDMEFLCMEFGEADEPDLEYPQLPFTVEGVEDEYDATLNPQNVIGCERFPKCEVLPKSTPEVTNDASTTATDPTIERSTSIISTTKYQTDSFELSSYVPVLNIFSKIGCGVAIICLVLALATYLSYKENRSKEQQQIFISFCISLVSLYVIFLFGIERTNPQWGCVVVSILLHYFTLTTILWMAVEAFTMYVNGVDVVGVHKLMLKASLVAWGVPAVVVAIIAVVDTEQYRNTHHCYIDIDYPFYFTQVLPLMLTILFNAYIFIRVMYRLTDGQMQSSSIHETSVASEMKKRAKRAFALSSLLGLTWVFGLFSLIREDATLTFQILFCVFNSLQGLFVFIMFCVFNDDIRAIWKVWCCKGSSDVPLYSSSTGKTGSSTVNYNKSEIAFSQM